ncbi:MAG TPA: HAMP domain-containing protein [Rhizobiales bacterium]|nr:HAMP domain-containing protein [Hyphomicrobiales bacterium]
MTLEAEQDAGIAKAASSGDPAKSSRNRRRRGGWGLNNWFSSLTRRIVILNLVALALLVVGILYLNQFRAGLIDAKVQSLRTQAEIIAGAIASSATIDSDILSVDPEALLSLRPGESLSPAEEEIKSLDFPINPERAAPVLRRLIKPARARARIYDREGVIVVDTRDLFTQGQILRYDLAPPGEERISALRKIWRKLKAFLRRGDLPLYREYGPDEGRKYPEVTAALSGASVSVVRVNKKGEMIVFVAVPVQRFRAVLGALVLSTKGGDIDAIVSAERWGILRVFLVAAGVTILMSFLLASAIVGPVKRLAAAAERVRKGRHVREEIPDFTDRKDEIGHLSGALRDMTSALYDRIDAIESFAADVAHELKNPLTSLRSAVETLPVARDEAARKRLIEIIQFDVRRLNRLISDISAASRLDAELSREEMEPVDIAELLHSVVSITNETRKGGPEICLDIEGRENADVNTYSVMGQSARLGQVVRNLIDNAVSFSPEGAKVHVCIRRRADELEIAVEDEGPGVSPDMRQRIFERFYTDRPQAGSFGQNSGLGLSISKQIVDAHEGRIFVEDRVNEDGKPLPTGARFVVHLPAMPLNSRES